MNLFNLFKKKKKYVQPTIEYIEKKYGIKLAYPYTFLTSVQNLDDPFYDELKKFGCSDILAGSSHLHKDCWGC